MKTFEPVLMFYSKKNRTLYTLNCRNKMVLKIPGNEAKMVYNVIKSNDTHSVIFNKLVEIGFVSNV